MAFLFQGANQPFHITILDGDGNVTPIADIKDIVISLYLETNYKRYIHWGLNPDPGITGGENLVLYKRYSISGGDDIDSQNMVSSGTGDDAGFDFYLQSEDTLLMPPGRYITQITYNTTNAPLAGGENTIVKGALITIKKSLT